MHLVLQPRVVQGFTPLCLALSVDSPESSILVIVLWFGRNSERPAAADTPASMVFAVFTTVFWFESAEGGH